VREDELERPFGVDRLLAEDLALPPLRLRAEVERPPLLAAFRFGSFLRFTLAMS
jgi:hypothetical protein